MGIELSILVDDVGFALDIGNEELRGSCQGRVDSVDGAVPVGGGFPCDVTRGDLVLPLVEVPLQTGITLKRDQAAAVGERVDDAQSPARRRRPRECRVS